MPGIYLHIPFCRKACHYCNFHFSTSLHRKEELVQALVQEIQQASFPPGIQAPERKMDTIYFGGGTPSLLSATELKNIFAALHSRYDIATDAEITLESNPDDITPEHLQLWKTLGINRLSIGVQSFVEDDLRWMNRAHNALQAETCIQLAKEYGFDNLTIDLIYGTPTLTDEHWQYNVQKAVSLGITHLSCYALTVEEKTALHHFIEKGKVPAVEEEKQGRHFMLLMEWMQAAGFEHYEISNFAKPGHRSRHNSHYWAGVPYYGFGPSAHSFDGQYTRWWNIASNSLYIENINNRKDIYEVETLSAAQRFNEKIMTGLRTMEGLEVNTKQGSIADTLLPAATFAHHYSLLQKQVQKGLLLLHGNHATLTTKGKLYADGMAADLFVSDGDL